MEPISISEIAKVMNARMLGTAKWTVQSICTNTREGVEPNSLFFALRGENTHGHRYVAKAFAEGAAAAVVEMEVADAGMPQLIVSNALQELGNFARYYRDLFDIPVIGVTGSVGKTSTKEMIALGLRASMKVHANAENFNTEIGVPRTLFGLERDHEAAVLEMAMRGPGQIKRLCEIARPSIGVVTNIGLSHIEFLGSRDGIASAKAELLQFLDADGVAVINADDEYADFLTKRCCCRVLTYGIERSADFRATNISYSSQGETRFKVNGSEFSVLASGKHHASNAAAACAVSSLFGLSLEQTAKQIHSFRPPHKRGDWFVMQNGAIVIDDTYNSAPDSTRSALQTLTVLAEARGKQRKVAVLGDMKELGDFSPEAHRYVGNMVKEEGVQMLITVGEAAEEIASAATHLPLALKHNFHTSAEAAEMIMSLIMPDDIVLIKGAREMKMERIVQAVDPGPPNFHKRPR